MTAEAKSPDWAEDDFGNRVEDKGEDNGNGEGKMEEKKSAADDEGKESAVANDDTPAAAADVVTMT
jgi:hypothetical protein